MEKYKTEYNDKGIIKFVYNFNKISSAEDAYFIGYMACDGGFISADGYPFMSVSSTEKYIIEYFSKYTSHAVVRNIGQKSSDKVKAINDVFELRFPSKMAETFKNFGIWCKKPERRLIGIPNTYFLSFFWGVLDSDGFISVTHRKDCRTPRLRFFITHGSEKFLVDLQNKLFELFNVNTTLRQHGPNVWRLQAQNTTQNITFLSKMLCENLPVFNIKKWTKLIEYFDNYVPQASDELLEPKGISSQAVDTSTEGSETTGEV
jgi:hypothetical protein